MQARISRTSTSAALQRRGSVSATQSAPATRPSGPRTGNPAHAIMAAGPVWPLPTVRGSSRASSMTSLSPVSITCWHNDCSAGLRRPAVLLLPDRSPAGKRLAISHRDERRWRAEDQRGQPRHPAEGVLRAGNWARRATRDCHSPFPPHVVTLHADIRAKRGPGLESLIQPQNACSTSTQVRVVGVSACGHFRGSGSNGGPGLGQRLRSSMTTRTMTTMTTMVPTPIYMGNSSVLGGRPPGGIVRSGIPERKIRFRGRNP